MKLQLEFQDPSFFQIISRAQVNNCEFKSAWKMTSSDNWRNLSLNTYLNLFTAMVEFSVGQDFEAKSKRTKQSMCIRNKCFIEECKIRSVAIRLYPRCFTDSSFTFAFDLCSRLNNTTFLGTNLPITVLTATKSFYATKIECHRFDDI